ncbi:urease accessory protein UreD [Jiella marina]|uniref:urease accessory protein UreD n=1 Tax=Jiella sp. LLJ827 TaxID=2917712 RepID=UPI0021009804|nr:urease accessory protein UreD [Jiella sp. LLJ827]MCQ0988613.1 urease accessory protein UreD [Jiella sp. LLJ827]
MRSGRTRLADLHQAGCLKLRFPRSLGPTTEAVVINTAGGLTGGDRLTQNFAVGPEGRLVLTSQACERIYRANAGEAEVATRIAVADDAFLAWLPQETILFDGARVSRRLDVEAASDARFVICEPVILGREMMGERIAAGRFRDRWRIRCGDRLVFAEETRLDGAIADEAAAAACLAGARAFATLVARVPLPDILLPKLREIVGESGGVSLFDGIIALRLAARSGFELRRRLLPAIAALAEDAVPRLWSL